MDQFKKMAFEQAKKEVQENEGQFMDQCSLVAKLLKHNYNALLEQGFSSYQALQIVIAHGITPGSCNNNKD